MIIFKAPRHLGDGGGASNSTIRLAEGGIIMPRKRKKRRRAWGSITEVDPGRRYVLRWVLASGLRDFITRR